MNPRSTEHVIRELSERLQPTRRIPRLRTAAWGVALLWMLAAAVALAVRGLRPDLLALLQPASAFTAILLGLALVAVGGVVAALAASVPGREWAGRLGLGLGLLGVLLAAGVGGLLVVREAGAEVPACPFENDLACFSVACLIALPPALGVLTFISRGAPVRPLLAVLTAGTGAVALGALLVHMSCPETSPRHVILSHTLAPMLGGLLLTLPFRAVLRRLDRAS